MRSLKFTPRKTESNTSRRVRQRTLSTKKAVKSSASRFHGREIPWSCFKFEDSTNYSDTFSFLSSTTSEISLCSFLSNSNHDCHSYSIFSTVVCWHLQCVQPGGAVIEERADGKDYDETWSCRGRTVQKRLCEEPWNCHCCLNFGVFHKRSACKCSAFL